MNKKDEIVGEVPPSADKAEIEQTSAGRSAASKDGALGAEIDLGAMGTQLRGLYKELLDEPVPDRFVKLLEELEKKESSKI